MGVLAADASELVCGQHRPRKRRAEPFSIYIENPSKKQLPLATLRVDVDCGEVYDGGSMQYADSNLFKKIASGAYAQDVLHFLLPFYGSLTNERICGRSEVKPLRVAAPASEPAPPRRPGSLAVNALHFGSFQNIEERGHTALSSLEN